MSDYNVEMVEAGTVEMEDNTVDGKSKEAHVLGGNSKSHDIAAKTYELPWLASLSVS